MNEAFERQLAQAINMAERGANINEISDSLGKSKQAVRNMLYRRGIKTVRVPLQPKEHPVEDKIIELRKQGLSYKAIRKELGCSGLYFIEQICKKHGMDGVLPSLEQSLEVDNVRDVIKRAGFTYLGGFTNTHGRVTVECKQGHVFDYLYHYFHDFLAGRCNSPLCPVCKQLEQQQSREISRLKKATKKAKAEAEHQQLRASVEAIKASREANKQILDSFEMHTCKRCGCEYCIGATGFKNKYYCSEKCKAEYKQMLARNHDAKRDAIINGREHDNDITLPKLYERDAGICYICGGKCDWRDQRVENGITVTGKWFPTIDHVKPISKGGLHKWGNIKLAHMICNSRKSNTFDESTDKYEETNQQRAVL